MTHTILELVHSMEKGGRTKRIIETAVGLERQGWRVRILSMTGVVDWVRDRYADEVTWLDLERRPKLDIPYVLRLARLIRKQRISLVHAHCEGSFFYGGLAGRLCGVPVVGTYHRSDLKYFQPTFRLRLFARLLNRAVAISNDRKQLMESRLNIRDDRITLIHGGVDLNKFQLLAAEKVQQLKRELGVENRRVLLSVGHLGPIKGHQITLQAMPRILERFPDVSWVVAGDGSEEDYARLNGMIDRLDLRDHVTLLGQTHNVTDWLNICDLFVQPSLEEGFGLVFVEAGACKKAVVSTTVGGIKDIVMDHETGLLVEPGDVDGLADAVNTLLSDHARAAEYARAGYERVHEHFSLRHMTEKYNHLFSGLLGRVPVETADKTSQ